MKDMRLTLDQVAQINEAHGGMPIIGDALGVICHGKDAVELLGADGKPNGWNTIARDPVTGLCSLSDLKAALGY
jgi:hypothetical protein